MTVYETDIPGVGRKYELELDGDDTLVVVVHHDSKRDVYRRSAETDESTRLFGLSGEQARRLGAVLEGTYFRPVELDRVEVPLGDAIIEWYELAPEAPLADATLAEVGVWSETGAKIIAVQRGGETHPSPNPDFRTRAGDVIVAVGTRAEQESLREYVRPR